MRAEGTNDDDVIAGIEQRIAKAWVERDRSTIDAMLAREWSVTDASGQVLTKEPDGGKESIGKPLRWKRIDAQAPAALASLAR